jgi:hypothetical protein
VGDLNPADFPAGTIGVVTGENARYTAFSQALMTTARPPGTSVLFTASSAVAANHEQLCERFTGPWIWILGTDHSWSPDCLLRIPTPHTQVRQIAPLFTTPLRRYEMPRVS